MSFRKFTLSRGCEKAENIFENSANNIRMVFRIGCIFAPAKKR